ncbi:Gr13 [Eciton burchellii]|nr:Gr13 [Eciton burchellii]
MKLFARQESLSDAIGWWITLDRLLGLRVFEYPRGQPRPVLSFIYLLVLYGFHCSTITLQNFYYINNRLLKLEYVLYQLLMYINFLTVLIKLILGWWHTKTFTICCRRMSEIDETLRWLGSAIRYNREYFMTVGFLTCWLLFSTIICSISFTYLQKHMNIYYAIYLILLSGYGLTVNTIVPFEFCVYARWLRIRFQLVNQLLYLTVSSTNFNCFETKYGEMPSNTEQQRKHVFHLNPSFRLHRQSHGSSNSSVIVRKENSQIQSHVQYQLRELRKQTQNHNSVTMGNQKRKERLQTIRQVHLELCKVMKTLCIIFGVQIAWEIGISIVLLTAICYNLYIRFILRIAVHDMISQTVFAIGYLLLNIVKLILLSYICKSAADEGNKTIEIVQMTYGYIADTDVQEEVQQFGIQIIQSPVAFSAFGISLNNKILTSSLKAVTTYLVIMIQMSNSLESNNSIQFAKYI